MLFIPKVSTSERSRAENARLFIELTGLPVPPYILSGYYFQMGWIKQRVSRYLVGFSTRENDLVIVQTGDRKKPPACFCLPWAQIESLRFTVRNKLILRTPSLMLRMFLPPFIATTMEAANLLPLRQQQELAAWKRLLRAPEGQGEE